MSVRTLEVANMAIAHTGSGKQISSLEEDSKEAVVCKQFIFIIRDIILKGYPWKFASVVDEPLSLIETNPNPDWLFSYLYPADCLKITKVGKTPSPYKRSLRKGRQVIYSNIDALSIDYISNVLPDAFPSDLALAWSQLLCFAIAPTVSEGNVNKIIARVEKAYTVSMNHAMENDANEDIGDFKVSPVLSAGGFIGIYP